jgi:hypothetical protein
LLPKRYDSSSFGKKPSARDPYSTLIPLNPKEVMEEEEIDEDEAIVKFNDTLQHIVTNYILSDSEKDKYMPSEVTSEWFMDPEFFKSPINDWEGRKSLKVKFEYGFDHKPSYLLYDMTREEEPLLLPSPEYFKESEGLEGTITSSGFYVMHSEQENKESGQMETRIMVGFGWGCTTILKWTEKQMDKKVGERQASDPTANEVKELRNKDGWKNMSIFKKKK